MTSRMKAVCPVCRVSVETYTTEPGGIRKLCRHTIPKRKHFCRGSRIAVESNFAGEPAARR